MVPLIGKHQADSKAHVWPLPSAEGEGIGQQTAENMQKSKYPNYREDLQLILVFSLPSHLHYSVVI